MIVKHVCCCLVDHVNKAKLRHQPLSGLLIYKYKTFILNFLRPKLYRDDAIDF